LSRDDIRELLDHLSAELARRGARADLFLVGGAAIAVAYDSARATRDLDAGRSQAELIREGINQVIHDHPARRPRMKARFHDETLVGRTEDLLEGFGE
jgi:Nucleotidyl transferase AbiEii toxin, Type IV TA system